MILQERNVPPFGGRVTDIDNITFLCVVTTAKSSLFGGLSTLVHNHSDGGICAQLEYNDHLSKSYRQQLHTSICEIIDSCGEKGQTLGFAVQTAINKLKEKDLLKSENNFCN
ncbi:MAG: hypothetical protein HOG33_02350 [Candidatus Marinimicrobia bacterium]|nr:hypothetical protein [Candidatus Neomarinimicrobiota bacterium]